MPDVMPGGHNPRSTAELHRDSPGPMFATMKRWIPCIAAAALASCVPNTPETRISADPAAFGALTRHQQGLVRQGRIDTGMPSRAVYLAWGRPQRSYTGAEGSTPTMVWEYDGTRPVYTNHFYGGYGMGPYPYSGYYRTFAYGPDVTYIPYRRATVWFKRDRVTKWERSE